jgi:hypothetical protein
MCFQKAGPEPFGAGVFKKTVRNVAGRLFSNSFKHFYIKDV